MAATASKEAPPRLEWRLLYPRWWPAWLSLGVLWLAVRLPYRWQTALGRRIGRAMRRLAAKRRAIAAANLALCLPDLAADRRARLLAQSFESMGIALFETGMAWFWPPPRLARLADIEGLEHLEKFDDRGVLLLSLHFTTLEIGAAILSLTVPLDGMYRHYRNPVYDFMQRRCRLRHSARGLLIAHEDLRSMVKALKERRIVWYAPDFSGGRGQSVFEPFFGVPVATTTATAKLARLSNAAVIPFTQHRLPDGRGYRLTVHPELAGFPSGDMHADARRINRFFEQQILAHPEQYLWGLKHFKTPAPPGPHAHETY